MYVHKQASKEVADQGAKSAWEKHFGEATHVRGCCAQNGRVSQQALERAPPSKCTVNAERSHNNNNRDETRKTVRGKKWLSLPNTLS